MELPERDVQSIRLREQCKEVVKPGSTVDLANVGTLPITLSSRCQALRDFLDTNSTQPRR